MAETRVSVPCINHPPMSASMRCDTCGTVYCRLCFRVENNMSVCKTCGTLGKPATEGQIRSEKDRRSTQFLNRVGGVGPVVSGAPPVPPQKSLKELQASGSRKGIPAAGAGGGGVPPPVIPVTTGSTPSEPEPTQGNGGTEPQFLKKEGPFFCKNHSQVKATRRCGSCVEYYCNECAKVVADNPICPGCSFPLRALSAEDQGFAPKPFHEQLMNAFSYPFKGRGLWVLLFISPFAWILGMAGFKGWVIAAGLKYAYFMKIVQASAIGKESPPEFPSMASFITDIGGPLFHFFCAWLVSMLPALLYLFLLAPVNPMEALLQLAGSSEEMHTETQEEMEEDSLELALLRDPQADFEKHGEEVEARKEARAAARREASGPSLATWFLVFTLLSFLGAVYYPMAIMSLALHRSLLVLNPVFIFQSIGKLGIKYFVPFIIYFIAEIVGVVMDTMKGDIFFIGTLISTFIWMYIMMVEMNVLGAIYFTHQRKLNWFGAK